jgi:hypothetical protein
MSCKKLKWVEPSPDNLPPEGVPLLVKYKHGIVSAHWIKKRYDHDGTFVFYTYIWQNIEGYMEAFISMDAFNSVFEKDE